MEVHKCAIERVFREVKYEGGGNEGHVLVEQAIEPEGVPDGKVVGNEHCVRVGEEGGWGGEHVRVGRWVDGCVGVHKCAIKRVLRDIEYEGGGNEGHVLVSNRPSNQNGSQMVTTLETNTVCV